MIAATPALVWMFAGVGLPWAIVALPRQDWRDRPMVACLTLAFGPGLVTAWMFALGSFGQPWLRLDTVLAGTAAIAAVGWALAWRKRNPLPLRSLEPLAASPLRKEREATSPPGPLSTSREGKATSPPGSLSTSRKGEKSTGQFGIRLRWDEKLLIGLIGVALVVRWLGVAYWPSTAYDALWVYAYEGKLYTLLGYIPNTIGYYPQFLPLQHTFLQLAVGGVNDHAARAVLPWLHLGSILAAYVLGNRLFNRRVGIYAAAMWALYPHVGEWSRFGDLEIPMAFLFTAAAAFFLMAWTENSSEFRVQSSEKNTTSVNYQKRYAVIAGLLLGIGMWTKPTMGAFIWGVALLVGAELARQFVKARDETGQRGMSTLAETIRATWPRLQVAVWTGLASIPLGAAWYVRNVLNGHAPIDLPPGFWQSLAAQSGAEFGWPLLAVILLVVWVVVVSGQRSAVSGQGNTVQSSEFRVQSENGTEKRKAGVVVRVMVGLGLVLAGVLPSIVQPHRMGILEWGALGAGGVVLFVALRRWAEGRWTDEGRDNAAKIGWAVLLTLPYFVTWFFSYSYHYRLSFAIVPLLILPTAVLIAQFRVQSSEFRVKSRRVSWVVGLVYGVVIIGLAIPGIIAPLYDPSAGWDWLWTDKLPDDHARYTSGNPALMSVVDGLQTYQDTHDEPMRVVAPGVKQLPFFFPLDDVQIDEMPTELEALEDTTYFIYGVPESGGDFNSFLPGHNQVLDALSIAATEEGDDKSVLRMAWGKDDGVLKYTVYELYLGRRWEAPEVTIQPEGEVVFGDFARFMGYDILSHEFWLGRKVITNFFWEVLEKPEADYVIFIHLRDADGKLLTTWDAPITRTEDGNYYSSLVWDAGEYIVDRRILKITDPTIPMGEDLQVVIGFYDRATEQRVPVTIEGQPAGNEFQLAEPFSRIPGEE